MEGYFFPFLFTQESIGLSFPILVTISTGNLPDLLNSLLSPEVCAVCVNRWRVGRAIATEKISELSHVTSVPPAGDTRRQHRRHFFVGIFGDHALN